MFPEFHHEKLFLDPQPLLHAVARNLAGGKRIGILVPMPYQVEQVYEFWGRSGVDVFVASASPDRASRLTSHVKGRLPA